MPDDIKLEPAKHYLTEHRISGPRGEKTVPAQRYNVHLNGDHIGHVETQTAYKDKKRPGSRIVESRKVVRRWAHTPKNDPKLEWARSESDFSTKDDAVQSLIRTHRSRRPKDV